MTASLVRTDGGSLTVDRNALVERWSETFGLDLASPVEGALVVQEVAHVAGLVDAAVAAERQRVDLLLLCPVMDALECIPDGTNVIDGVVYDGAMVRERLRQAYLAVRDGSPAIEREASFEGADASTDGRKPVDAYLTDQTGVSNALRARQNHSDPKETR